MQDIEPFYNWRHIYISEEDEHSPFYGRVYSEFEFSQTIYNYYIHPQWDDFGSRTLYLKVLMADYDEHYLIMELIGEWNDAIENDIMELKREVTDKFFAEGITKFILITENVLNFHSDGRDYYEEWFEDVEDGWIAAVKFRDFVEVERKKFHLDYYINFGGTLNIENWRTMSPVSFYETVKSLILRRLY
jgi:hypothetical protein